MRMKIFLQYVAIVLFWIFFFFLLLGLNASYTGDAKTAVIFIHPDMHWREKAPVWIRAHVELLVLYRMGYRGYIVSNAREDKIAEFIMDGKISALSYFGHEHSPKIARLYADGWRSMMYDLYYAKYKNLGIAEKDAHGAATQQSKNFGLDLVRNHSCFSLKYTSLAKLFVRSGGIYYGAREYYTADPFFQALQEDTDFLLEKYQVP